ncbi:MAG: sortase domain-containing protein [Candidatus Dormibacteraceae bacterium]
MTAPPRSPYHVGVQMPGPWNRLPTALSRRLAALVLLAGILLGAAAVTLTLVIASTLRPGHPAVTATRKVTQSVPPSSGGAAPPLPSPTAVPVPPSTPAAATVGGSVDRLLIPSIGVSAHIEEVGVTPQNTIGVPANVRDVAWYDRGAFPGAPGDAIIDGHLDWYTGPAVFWNLARIKIGEPITVVLSDGRRVNFAVTAILSLPFTSSAPGEFDTSGPARLSLITCSGQWDAARHVYRDRLIVEASRQS